MERSTYVHTPVAHRTCVHISATIAVRMATTPVRNYKVTLRRGLDRRIKVASQT
jgi:hypothetical protein